MSTASIPQARPAPAMRRQGMSDRQLAAWMVAPAIAIIAAVAFYPIVHVAWTSLYKEYPIFGIHEFVGLGNYAHLAVDPRFWNALFNTFYFTVATLVLELLLGLAIAVTLNEATRGRGLLRAAVLVPWCLPTVVSARMWEFILNSNYGILNYLVGAPINWTGHRAYAMLAAIMADVWKTTPFVVLLLLAGLQVIPDDLYKAARVDGASAWRRFREITLPLLMPSILVVLLFRTLDAFRVFDLIYVLTGGGPANTTETLSIYAYKVLFEMSLTGYGSTLAVVVFLCVLAISALYVRLLSRRPA